MTTRERKRKAAIDRIVAVHVESHQRALKLERIEKVIAKWDKHFEGSGCCEAECCGEDLVEELKKAFSHQPQRGRSYRASAPNTTRLGWMEKREDLCVDQFHCPSCEKIFYYVNDTDDTLPPKFCPECGRKNLRA